ncbi:MAG: AbrB/MazE/SpoVT family DNA-binding domain-containing protein [Oscillospiraceae bacterium]|jgi:AbrB family looped-hinge helix DNA binding protein|nr:AbrB/MazE/SpoVT family DNA-binding domain-containing protein [Oscillospiraceae bacterium]
MNLAKVSTNGQITIPVEIRRLLKLKDGDKVLFYRKRSGEVVINNTSLVAIQEALAETGELGVGEAVILGELAKGNMADHTQKPES